MVHLNAAIQQHEREIMVADREHQIPAHRPQDHLGGELPAFEGLIPPHPCGLSLSRHARVCSPPDRQDKDATEPLIAGRDTALCTRRHSAETLDQALCPLPSC